MPLSGKTLAVQVAIAKDDCDLGVQPGSVSRRLHGPWNDVGLRSRWWLQVWLDVPRRLCAGTGRATMNGDALLQRSRSTGIGAS